MTTALRAMTTDELRDWLAHAKGWVYQPGPAWQWWRFENGEKVQSLDPLSDAHPFPPTLDAAAAALPPGWVFRTWIDDEADGNQLVRSYVAAHELYATIIIPDTGDEIHDRLLLACLCIESQGASR